MKLTHGHSQLAKLLFVWTCVGENCTVEIHEPIRRRTVQHLLTQNSVKCWLNKFYEHKPNKTMPKCKNMHSVAGILHFSKVSLSISRLPPFPILRLEPVSRMPWRNLHIFPPKVWSKCSSQRLSPAHLQLLLCQDLLLGELLASLWLTQRSRHQHGDWRVRRKHLKRFQGDVDSRFNWRLLDWRLIFFRCGKMNMKKSPSWLRYVQLQVQKKHISMACTQQMYSYKFWQTFQSSSISGFLTFL